ncbi:hypothetical protein GH714_043356 [Hevea brasiliensis]|uniref:Uncharacterized protein n=1 Tax=Hevea brasiliensis TaxID=3981 RepID=A0A6A6K2B4_HEVBR|nr:hypothetical protein GH714_043356 [Hevea brasiliensis]
MAPMACEDQWKCCLCGLGFMYDGISARFGSKALEDPLADMRNLEQIREGKVNVLTPREAGYTIQLNNKTLLDLFPSVEKKKTWFKGLTWIPILEVDDRFEIGTISRKITNFMMDCAFVGGCWSGVSALSYDNQFLSKVEDKFPKDMA